MTTARPITVYTLTLNEARQIRAVLESVKWADEILVLDSFSTDGTVEVARQYDAVIVQEAFCGFGRLRNHALAAATHDWVLSIDADERCTPELAAEIRQELQAPRFEAYQVPRKSHFLGHWMRHSGWYPDCRQPQLFNRQNFRYHDEAVHESYTLTGRLGCLRQHLLQYPWDTLEIATAKLQRNSTLMAERYAKQGKRASPAKMLFAPAGMFLRLFLLQQGFRDGRHGFVLATLYAYYTFLKYAKLWERSVKTKERGGSSPE